MKGRGGEGKGCLGPYKDQGIPDSTAETAISGFFLKLHLSVKAPTANLPLAIRRTGSWNNLSTGNRRSTLGSSSR